MNDGAVSSSTYRCHTTLICLQVPTAETNMTQARMIKIDDLFSVTGSKLTPGVQHARASGTSQLSKRTEAVPTVPQAIHGTADPVCDTEALNQARGSSDVDGSKIEGSSTLTASELLAKLNPKAQATQLTLASEPAVGAGAADIGSGLNNQRMSNVLPQPPPVVDKPTPTPNIIAQLFSGSAGNPSVSARKDTPDDGIGNKSSLSAVQSAEVASNDQLKTVTATSLPNKMHRASVKQLFHLLIEDDRFLDAVADAMSDMAIRQG